MLTMSTLMMPTTMTTMTNPGPIPAHSVPQKIEPPKLTAAATLAHTTTAANKSGGASAMEEAGGKKESYNHRHEEKTSLMVETRLAKIQGDF
ncbi:nucleolysin TIAR isoform X7 [Vespula squamosa]|uniref:Nucleolysin TIAR isoform X7 n=1 Tax=Vespula squamosa TaxID=30214 RepID=A0ABD2A8T4_VESSQ